MTETRNILDSNGNVIGTITLPTGTPESKWQEVISKHTTTKSDLILAAYERLNSDVYGEMTVVFGTTNADSATAYEKTWALMKNDPAGWASLGLKDDSGSNLDTEQKVLSFANTKLAAVEEYGKWRMIRIEQFRAERASILAS
jgi:hypothetical protein